MDRNTSVVSSIGTIGVALRKESVDRNQVAVHFVTLSAVALRKESVDRNIHQSLNLPSRPMSLSARRAWIEIRGARPIG